MNLNGKSFFITGISSGLGLEITKQLLELGAKVYGTYLGDATQLQNLDQSNLKYWELDNMNYMQTKRIVDEIDTIDFYINNAGIYVKGELEDCSPDRLIKLINANLTGAMLTTQAVLPKLKAQNQGIIFFVNSINGVENEALRSIYGGSKWGLRGFATNLRMDLKETNIKVFNLYPDGMQTGLFSNAELGTDTTEFMRVEDIAALIIANLENSDKYIVDEITIHRWK